MSKKEWRDWAAQFDAEPKECFYVVTEGPHRRACLKKADYRSKDNYPACARHKNQNIRDRWIGYAEGA